MEPTTKSAITPKSENTTVKVKSFETINRKTWKITNEVKKFSVTIWPEFQPAIIPSSKNYTFIIIRSHLKFKKQIQMISNLPNPNLGLSNNTRTGESMRIRNDVCNISRNIIRFSTDGAYTHTLHYYDEHITSRRERLKRKKIFWWFLSHTRVRRCAIVTTCELIILLYAISIELDLRFALLQGEEQKKTVCFGTCGSLLLNISRFVDLLLFKQFESFWGASDVVILGLLFD